MCCYVCVMLCMYACYVCMCARVYVRFAGSVCMFCLFALYVSLARDVMFVCVFVCLYVMYGMSVMSVAHACTDVCYVT